MKSMKIKSLTVFTAALLVFGMVSGASALTIDPTWTPNWTGTETSNSLIMVRVNTILSGLGYGSYTELYKQNYGGSEEGSLAASYMTTFSGDPNNAVITYVGGPYIAPPPVFVLVKDGNATPSWYLFQTNWNGLETLYLNNFWLGPGGAISHVSLLGTTAVPEPVTLLLLGLGLVGVAGIRRFKK